MLNKNGERELAYVATITDITPIEGADKVELAHVNGWTVMVRKNQFKVGDLCVYFEIDSKVPETETFAFLERYKYRVKTQRFIKGTVLSQGLVMTLEELGLDGCTVGDFVTDRLGVTYYEPEDNIRKASSKKLLELKLEKFISRWTLKHRILSKVKLFVELRKKLWVKKYNRSRAKKKSDWPYWVTKTDEERCQNLPRLFVNNDKEYIGTEKIDGTSTTFTMKQAPKKKRRAIVCSRNVVFDTPEKEEKNFYKDTDGNVYLEMFEKYQIRKVLEYILDKHPEYEFITLQGETYGGTIQKRNYGPEHRCAIFNYIYKEKGHDPVRLNPIQMREAISTINANLGTMLEVVPILFDHFKLPDTCEKLLECAEGKSQIDGNPREGIVFRDVNGNESFKSVSNSFLEKFHS